MLHKPYFMLALNQNGYHIEDIGLTALILRNHIELAVVYIYPNTTNCNIYFTSYKHICPRNKYG